MADFTDDLLNFESGGRNVTNKDKTTSSGRARGYWQITDGTWKEFGEPLGVDFNKYPTSQDAPDWLQTKVASTIPMKRWAPETLAYLKNRGHAIVPDQTLAENAALNNAVLAVPSAGKMDPSAQARGSKINPAIPAGPLAAPTATPAADDSPWYSKLFQKGTDPNTGKPTPSIAESVSTAYERSNQTMKAKEADQAPDESITRQLSRSPGGRNVGPLGGAQLASAPQTYMQALAAAQAPLTWNNLPPQAPQGPRAGFQPAPTYVPGMSINSFSMPTQNLGYGIDPVGYGFG